MELAAEAGYPRVSLVSILAGVLVAYGAFAILAAIAGGVMNAFGVDTHSLTNNDWRQLGIGTGAAAAISLLISYLFGGYVAGRMARRSGALNGFLVFVLGLLVAAGVGAAVGLQTNSDAVMSNLRSIGVPTSMSEWTAIGTIAGVAALACMLLGALFGGISGERWHGKLVRRALDPTVGPHAVETTPDGPREVDLRDRTDGAHFRRDDEEPVEVRGDGEPLAVRRNEATEDGEITRTLH
jgi:hypothetical protein